MKQKKSNVLGWVEEVFGVPVPFSPLLIVLEIIFWHWRDHGSGIVGDRALLGIRGSVAGIHPSSIRHREVVCVAEAISLIESFDFNDRRFGEVLFPGLPLPPLIAILIHRGQQLVLQGLSLSELVLGCFCPIQSILGFLFSSLSPLLGRLSVALRSSSSVLGRFDPVRAPCFSQTEILHPLPEALKVLF